jgi:hypothetical protein
VEVLVVVVAVFLESMLTLVDEITRFARKSSVENRAPFS